MTESRPDVEQIARAAVALCADILRRCHGDQISTIWMSGQLRDQWGRQVLAWQDQLDQR